jgi:DNA-binding response OmpR family regulator
MYGKYMILERLQLEVDMNILIVEDHPSQRKLLLSALRANGYLADAAADAETGLAMLQNTKYDLIILDIMLPMLSGIEALKKIRSNKLPIRVIFLTAMDGVCDRVLGLDMGADDYLVKPFHLDELLSRVRALLRRPAHIQSDDVIAVGNLVLNVRNCEVAVNGEAFLLGLREARLLALLIQNSSNFVSKQKILNSIWGYFSEVEPNNVEIYIHRLRSSEFYAKANVTIETRRGVGYRLTVQSNA